MAANRRSKEAAFVAYLQVKTRTASRCLSRCSNDYFGPWQGSLPHSEPAAGGGRVEGRD